MKKHILIIMILFVFLFSSHAYANMPAIYHVILDASGSVSENDFNEAKLQTYKFAEGLYQKSQLNPGVRADWLSVNYFGGRNEYTGSIFINCSIIEDMELLKSSIAEKAHPKYKQTAIYDAIGLALTEVYLKDMDLPGEYLKTIILITDGKDKDSNEELKLAVKSKFPNIYTNLFVIGVGSNIDVKEFQGIADNVFQIDDFDELGTALMFITQIMP